MPDVGTYSPDFIILIGRADSAYWLKDRKESGQPRRKKTPKRWLRIAVVRRAQLCDYTDPEVVEYGELDIETPTAQLIVLRDASTSRTGAADNLIKTIRAVYT